MQHLDETQLCIDELPTIGQYGDDFPERNRREFPFAAGIKYVLYFAEAMDPVVLAFGHPYCSCRRKA